MNRDVRGTSAIRRGGLPLVSRAAVGALLALSASVGACLVSTSGLEADGQMDASAVDASDGAAAFDATTDSAPAADTGVTLASDAASDAMAATDAPARMDAGSDASPYDQLVLADSPAAYWPFDEAAGANIALDVIAGRAAAAQGAVTFGVAGISGTAVRVAGGSFLNAGDVFDEQGQDPFAIEFWFEADASDAGYQNLISKRGQAGTDGYVIYGANGPVVQFEENGEADAGDPQRDGWGPVDFAAGWVHVVLTLDVDNHVHLYLNGVEVTKEFDATGGPAPNGIDLTFGVDLTGEMDAVAFYGHALSAVQVNAHYQAGKK